MIGVTVQIQMDQYWTDKSHSQMVRLGIIKKWMDALEDWHIDQIEAGFIQWQREKDRKPGPEDIAKILTKRRGLVYAGREIGAQRDPVFALDRPAEISNDRKAICS